MDKPSRARPVSLPLLRLSLPLPAWVSLLHRLSGVLLVCFLPPALLALEKSLRGPEAFAEVVRQFDQPAARLALLVAVWALAHHALAGIRHLFLDLHLGVSLAAARRSALAVLLFGAAVAAVTAWRLFA